MLSNEQHCGKEGRVKLRSKGREKNKAREGEQGKNSGRVERKLLYLVIQVTGVE